MRTRTRGGALVAAGALAVASACGSGADTASDGTTYLSLGASVAVTGSAASIGTEWRKGIELAVKMANADGGFEVDGERYKWKLDLRDNESDPARAIANYRAFVGEEVDFIVGPGLSTAFVPAFNSLGNANPIVMTPSLTASQFVDNHDNLFITHLDDRGSNGRVAKMVSVLMSKFAPQRVAILLPQDGPGERYTSLFSKYFESAGASIVYSEAFPTDTRDFSSYIAAIRSTNPDLVVSGYLDSWLRPFLKQAANAGFTKPVFVGAPGSTVAALDQTGGRIQDFAWSVTTRAVSNSEDPAVQEFRKAYRKEFGSLPDTNSFWALSYYDPILMLTQAIQNAGTVEDTGAIAEALPQVSKWPHSVMSGHFDPRSNQLVYAAQMGISSNGEISYIEAK